MNFFKFLTILSCLFIKYNCIKSLQPNHITTTLSYNNSNSDPAPDLTNTLLNRTRQYSVEFVPLLQSDIQKKRALRRKIFLKRLLEEQQQTEDDKNNVIGDYSVEEVFDKTIHAKIQSDNGELIISADSFNLKSYDKSIITKSDINFGELATFYPLTKDIIKTYNQRPFPLRKVELFSDAEILKHFTNFGWFSVESYRTSLSQFPCYEKFILSFDEQLNNNPLFKQKLLTKICNGREVVQFIRSEARQIKRIDNQLKKEFLTSNDLSSLREKLYQDTDSNNTKTRKRLEAIEETIKNNTKSTQQYNLPQITDFLLTKLNISRELFETKTGTIADHQLHQELVNGFIGASQLYQQTSSKRLQSYAECAAELAAKGIMLNDTNKSAAYSFSDAVSDILAFGNGVRNAFNDNVQEINKFLEHPIDVSIDKFKNLYNLFQSSVTNTCKAIFWSISNSPEDHESYLANPQLATELDQATNERIELKAQEIRQACDHIVQIFNNMTREEKFKNVGYIITDLVLTHNKGKLLSNALSINPSNLKELIERGSQRLEKLGQIGDEIAKTIGVAAEKGITATEALLDFIKNKPEAALAKGGIYKFAINTFDKDKKFVQELKQISALNNFNNSRKTIFLAKNGQPIKGFTRHGIDRAVGDVQRKGAKAFEIFDALKNPLKISGIEIDEKGKKIQKFFGKHARVIVNPDTGLIVSVNPLGERQSKKLLKKIRSNL